jgi:hypothetical protein
VPASPTPPLELEDVEPPDELETPLLPPELEAPPLLPLLVPLLPPELDPPLEDAPCVTGWLSPPAGGLELHPHPMIAADTNPAITSPAVRCMISTSTRPLRKSGAHAKTGRAPEIHGISRASGDTRVAEGASAATAASPGPKIHAFRSCGTIST